MATTLEPIFHRDFRASYRQIYPAAPFKNKLKISNRKKKTKPKPTIYTPKPETAPELDSRSSSNIVLPVPVISSPAKSVKPDNNRQNGLEINLNFNREMTRSETELMEKLTVLEREIEAEENESEFADKISDYADKVASSILGEILGTKQTLDEYVSQLVENTLVDALATFERNPSTGPYHTGKPPSVPMNVATNILGNVHYTASDADEFISDVCRPKSSDAPHPSSTAKLNSQLKISQH